MKKKLLCFAILTPYSLCVWHLIQSVFPQYQYLNLAISTKGEYPISSFNIWLGMDVYSTPTNLYYLLFPVWGIIGIIFSKVVFKNIAYSSKKTIVKKIHFFTIAGAYSVTPLIMDFFLTCMFLPIMKPESITKYSNIDDASLFANMFYSNPWLYTIVYLAIDYIVGGLLGLIFYEFTRKINNIFSLLSTLGIYGGIISIEIIFKLQSENLLYLITPGQPYGRLSGSALLIQIIILFLIVIILNISYSIGGKGKNEKNLIGSNCPIVSIGNSKNSNNK